MAIAALVIGIISIVLSFFGMGIYGAILGIVGVVLGVLGKKDPERKGMATAGMVCSIVGIVLGLIFWIACLGVASSLSSSLY